MDKLIEKGLVKLIDGRVVIEKTNNESNQGVSDLV